MSKINDIIADFQEIDNDFRLELLLDYSEKLPAVPEKYLTKDQIESHKVHECQTPVSLWVEVENSKVHIFADVPRESPTVRGFISMLIAAFNGKPPSEVENASNDILQETGLSQTLGMNRMYGLSTIYQRVKSEVKLQQER